MKFHWETEEERLRRSMKISPKAKLEWLRQMSEFALRCLPHRNRQIRLQLRKHR